MEDNFTETYIEYLDPHGLELDSEKDKEVHEEIPWMNQSSILRK
jgi:hypothetical protein